MLFQQWTVSQLSTLSHKEVKNVPAVDILLSEGRAPPADIVPAVDNDSALFTAANKIPAPTQSVEIQMKKLLLLLHL